LFEAQPPKPFSNCLSNSAGGLIGAHRNSSKLIKTGLESV
jgi:hypothetical protein